MKINQIYIFLLVFLVSCSEYQKLLKSDDAELKYNKAIEYYGKKDYIRASTLFESVASYYKGTERSEEVLYYLANSYVGQQDYFSSSEYFKKYVRNYPKGKHAVEAKYMVAFCYYKDSPDARLDQEATNNAVEAFQEFIELYPESEYVKDATKYLDEMNNKLAFKCYLNAKLYYDLGNYLGNNYQSAEITAENALKKYPNTSYREDLSFVILQSKFQEALLSVELKKIERYRIVIDEYYSFINEFPDGKHRKKADKILQDSKLIVKD
jgi:outer membrane protein assembly factor BamD